MLDNTADNEDGNGTDNGENDRFEYDFDRERLRTISLGCSMRRLAWMRTAEGQDRVQSVSVQWLKAEWDEKPRGRCCSWSGCLADWKRLGGKGLQGGRGHSGR